MRSDLRSGPASNCSMRSCTLLAMTSLAVCCFCLAGRVTGCTGALDWVVVAAGLVALADFFMAVVPRVGVAVLCLLTNTPWPWPTPAKVASARGGFPSPGTERQWSGRGAAQRRSAQAQRGKLGCLLRALGADLPRKVWLPCLGVDSAGIAFVLVQGLEAGPQSKHRKFLYQMATTIKLLLSKTRTIGKNYRLP